MKVLYITNVPVPYRVDFFNELGLRCKLTVLFEKDSSNERNELWKKYRFENFVGIILNGISINTDSAICFDVIKYIRKKEYDYLIIDNLSSPTGMMALQYAKKHKIPYGFEIDGGFAKSGKGIKEKIKKHFISGATYYLSPAVEADRYLLQYGAEEKRIYRYPFTSIKKIDIINAKITVAEKKKLRNKFNINEDKVIISVGQFIYRKGFDWLLKAICKIDKNIGLYIIGGQPIEEYTSFVKDNELTNVHFIDFMAKDDLKLWYFCADLFVLPTREDIWGLVINEAMAYGLPIITTRQCIAGLELVEEGVNGYLVEAEDIDSLRDRINKILNSDVLRIKMGNSSLRIIQDYTIEKMVQRHLEVLEKLNQEK